MIRTNAFSFEESSFWDPKVIREYLFIPEDQLNVLRNLPEWSKNKDEDRISVIGKDTDISQSSKVLFASVSEKNQELYKQNLDLFKETSENQNSLLEAHKKYFKFPRKSTSLLDISKIREKRCHKSPLKYFASVPNISLCTENIHVKYPTLEFELKKSVEERELSLPVKNSLNVSGDIGRFYISDQTNSGNHKLESKSKTFTEKQQMDVISQKAVVGSQDVNKIESKEVYFEKYIDNETLPTFQSLTNTSLANHSSLNEDISPDKCISNKTKDVIIVNDSTSLNSSEKNVEVSCLVKDTVLSNSDQLNLRDDKAVELTESLNSQDTNEVIATVTLVKDNLDLKDGSNKFNQSVEQHLCKRIGSINTNFLKEVVTPVPNVSHKCVMVFKNPSDVKATVTEETIPMNITSTSEIKTDTDNQKLVNMNVTSSKSLELTNAEKMEASVTNLTAPNDLDKNSCSSDISKQNVEDTQQTVHRESSDNKSVFAETLSHKRKLESKNRSSKKRKNTQSKEGSLEKRSIKSAGEIRYSVESIKTMLSIMKAFVDI